ncbi:MAG: uroporphyrinogen-III C-methyltransferase [Candidatus Omnitrophica bacterium]|nr:uroporphyrinogen-III C-methyltransferase [Candidatus Omnitrophota bacterium]
MRSVPKIILKVGSRASPLAKVQVDEVFALLAKAKKQIQYALTTFATKGDLDKKTSLLKNSDDNFFSDVLDDAVLAGTIDIAIHSAKDVPKVLHPGLKIFALTKALDETDALVGPCPCSQLPQGSRIGTSSLLRKEQILTINPNLKIIDIRGTIQERLKLLDAGKMDALIVATCALKRLGLHKRIKEVLPWEGTPLQGQLAVVGRQGDEESEKIFSSIDIRRQYGKVFLVGAGPGDPELFTLKGVQILRKADIVFYDYLVHKNVLDYALTAKKVDVGKRKGESTISQRDLSRLLKEAVMRGQMVVRLKGGDPLIFGRGAEEIEYLRAYHIEVEVIPGVTSATGIPSSLGIPLTARDFSSSVAFLSGHGQSELKNSQDLIPIPQAQTLVFLMGLTKLDVIVKSLSVRQWSLNTPVAIISRGTQVDEKVLVGDLSNIQQKMKQNPLPQPALIIVGQTVSLFLAKCQQKKNILYLGTYPEKYHMMGRLIHFPMIAIAGVKVKNARHFIKAVKLADTILLTSRCGVKYFFEFLAAQNFSLDILRRKIFIVIGADTEKQLNVYNFSATLVAHDETSEGLFKEMRRSLCLKGRSIVFPRSSITNPYLRQQLAKSGAAITEVVVYENTKPPYRKLPSEEVEQIIFTSPSTVHNFLADYGKIPSQWTILAKGRRTQKSLREQGYLSEILVQD